MKTPEHHDEEIEQLFGQHGQLGGAVSNFRPRQAQIDMAKAIAQAIATQTSLIAEAGTGTGKTFAYLVPALLWGGKVIISTGTKNLQDQLFLKDIPTVRQALKAPVDVALLKGRANYVCHLHLEMTNQSGQLSSREDVRYLSEISRFIHTTKRGDKAELASVPESAPVWNLVTSTKDNCLGQECSYAKDCFLMKARREAQKADVVVVNHHLFFADVALKDNGVSDLLPKANTVIFDEAHQLPDAATLFFGETISTSHVIDLARDMKIAGMAHARDGAKWDELVEPLIKAARDVRLTLPSETLRVSFTAIPNASEFFAALQTLKSHLTTVRDLLEKQAERHETLTLCYARAVNLLAQYEAWDKPNPEFVLWVETFLSTVQLHRTPLSIASIFNKQREGAERSWIFTSATLAVKKDFSHYAAQMGLVDEKAISWPSPFQYEQQGILYIPTGLPNPSTPTYMDAVIDAALPVMIASRGRAFLLCTTLRAVKHSAHRLREEFAKRQLPFPLFVQGELGRTELLEQFRRSGNGVLIGSQSFWEGIDVRGHALSLVVIDKMPFAPPDDPVLSARLSALEKQGKNGFLHHQLPEAIINLKQGAGRLIRDEMDRGVLMLCDPRILSKPYGARVWQSMPSFKRTRDLSVVEQFFHP